MEEKINEDIISEKLNKYFLKNSTSIEEIKMKIECHFEKNGNIHESHFKSFKIEKLKNIGSSINYVIDKHEFNDPTIASKTEHWNEEHITKAINRMHRSYFKNCFWDSEVPLYGFGKIDLLLGQDQDNGYFKDIKIIELKDHENPRKGLKEALYYAHIMYSRLNQIIKKLEISIVLITYNSKNSEKEISKEMLSNLKKDIDSIHKIYADFNFKIYLIEMKVEGRLPILISGKEVPSLENIKLINHGAESREFKNLKELFNG